MAASLVRDGDLAFAEADLGWARERLPEGVTVILQRTERGLRYSKPTLYPLLVAPLYALAGESGIVLANGLALGAALWLAWALWRGRAGRGGAALLIVGFAASGALLPYVVWRMSDAMQVALALAGLVLGVGALRAGAGVAWLEARWTAWAGGLLLGLAVSMRVPNLAAPAAAVAVAALAGRRRRAVALVLGTVLGLALAWGASELLITTWNPYRAVRTSFDGATGYPVGPGGEAAARRFDLDPATNRLGLLPRDEPERIAYAALYFFVGRHSGIAVYFPAALLLAAAAFSGRRDRATWALVGGAAAICLFYVAWIPQNYFGGSTFVGNRYFLTAYALLLVAPARPPRLRWWLAVWAVALFAGGSAVASVAASRALDPMSQSHANAGLFRRLPYETTGRRIDGQRDRYWAGDFVRLVDPWAEAGRETVTLTTGRPPAELVVATSWPGDVLALEVTADRPGLELLASDWAGSSRHALAVGGATRIELAPSAGWRRHRFWWSEDLYHVRTLRLSLRASDSGPAHAEIRYLGRQP